MLSRSNIDFRRTSVNSTALRAQNQTTSEQSTTKLFKAIDDENLEDFKRALAEGANVNAFDKESMTPLISIITNLSVSSGKEKEYQNMIRLLLLQQSIDVNIYEQNNRNTALHLAMCFQQKKVLQLLLSHPNINTYLQNKRLENPKECARQNRAEHLIIEIQKARTGRQLLNVLSCENFHEAKVLLNQELNPNCWKRLNGEIETPLSLIIKSCLQGITEENKKEVLTKFLKHKDLDFSQTKPIPAIEQNSRLKQIIEQAMKERLTDAVNRKDLDDVKKLVEDNCFMNDQIVIEVLKSFNPVREYLNEKFPTSAEQPVANTHNVQPEINDEFIAQELQRLENLEGELERTKARLTEKEQELNKVVNERTRDTSKISQLERELRQVRQDNQERIHTFTDQVARLTREKSQLENLRSELERTKIRLREKEQELDRVVSGRTRDTDKISQLERDLRQERLELQAQNQDLKNKNRKLSEASIYNKRQSNYASASFVLSGAFAVGACLTISNLEICISLAVAAFVFIAIGCYCSYKASTVLSDVTSTEFGNVISL
ncbi:MAG: TomO hydrophobic C-terminal domain-containing protein [Wolbachia sp.]